MKQLGISILGNTIGTALAIVLVRLAFRAGLGEWI